jgi:hypothetical protein
MLDISLDAKSELSISYFKINTSAVMAMIAADIFADT